MIFINDLYNLSSYNEKELKRLRKEVHYYLDSLWLFSSNRKTSRTALYKWLSNQMNIDIFATHVRYFSNEQCREALKILKARYKQYYGKNNISKTEKKKLDKMYKEKPKRRKRK